MTSGLVLLAYWFRHRCLAILDSRPSRDYAKQAAKANRLKFPEIQNRLQVDTGGDEFNSLRASLVQDYRMLSYLLRHTADFQPGPQNLGEWMLMADFHLMHAWYWLTVRVSHAQAKYALEEMSRIVNHLAHCMGRRTALAGSTVSHI